MNVKVKAGRPSRKIPRVDYKAILDLEDLESDKNFEKYLDEVKLSIY